MVDILLIILLIFLLGGFTHYRGYWGPGPYQAGAPGWDPVSIILLVIIILAVLSLLSPWPFHHSYYHW